MLILKLCFHYCDDVILFVIKILVILTLQVGGERSLVWVWLAASSRQ